MNVLFIRRDSIDRQDNEWLEPIQMCCAFDCHTTLLLLPPASAQAVQCNEDFAALVELGIAAIHVVGGACGTHSTTSSEAEATALMCAHSTVLSV